MSRRRALLIGVEHYPHPDYRDLPCVPADLDRMDAALTANGYTVERCSYTKCHDIEDAIATACDAAEAGDTLVIYFTGHGQSFGNRPFLVPGNVRPRSALDRFIDADLSRATKDSAAALVVLLVDACRDPADHKGGMAGWGAPPPPATGPVCVTLFGCAHNQICEYAGEPPQSLFTVALAEALAPEDKARTIAEVIASAQRRLDGLSDRHGKLRQAITSWGDRALGQVICDGPDERALRELNDPWLVAALRSPLWDKVGDADAVGATRAALRPSIEACRAVYDEAIAALGDDPWRDADLPRRIIAALGTLLTEDRTDVRLTAAELAAALLAPFAREAALATAAHLMAPDDVEIQPSPARPRAAFQEALTLHPRLARQAKRLRDRDAPEDARAVGLLVAYRAAARAAGTWRQSPDGWLPCPVHTALATAPTPLRPLNLLSLTRCLGHSPSAELDPTINGVRLRLLGGLLSVAAALAVDGRRLSDVIIDHVGLSDPVHVAALIQRLPGLTWDLAGTVWSAALTCVHPAEGAALEAHVEATQELLDHIRVTLLADMGADDARWLPVRVDARGIQPADTEAGPAYRTPHVSFHLDPARVRELLMGTELYGEPALAIRELYQNALDACRYRERRRDYLIKTRGAGPDTEWEGEIAFEEGEDERGAYIDCIDNGVGMTWDLLTQCYACAGRRFAETPEFIDEHADWLRVDEGLRLHPNSQFGIGVLSVFMLAEEVHVTTRRYERDGTLGEPLHVRIAGSGSLFRLIEPCPVDMPDAGTRVRLYLARTLTYDGNAVSLEALLDKLVWRPYYSLRVGDAEPWPAGDLRYTRGDLLYTTSGDAHAHEVLPDLWWVRGVYLPPRPGALLYDGVIVTARWHWAIVVDFPSSTGLRLRADRGSFVSDVEVAAAEQVIAAGPKSLLLHQPIPTDTLRLIRDALGHVEARQLERTLIESAADMQGRDGSVVNAAAWGVDIPRTPDWLHTVFRFQRDGYGLGLTLDELDSGLLSIPMADVAMLWAGLTDTEYCEPSVAIWLRTAGIPRPRNLHDIERLVDESPPLIAEEVRDAVGEHGRCRVFDLVWLAYHTGRDLLQAWERVRSLAPLGVVAPPVKALEEAPLWYHLVALAGFGDREPEDRWQSLRSRAQDIGLDVPEVDIEAVLRDLPGLSLRFFLHYLAELNPRPNEVIRISLDRLLDHLVEGNEPAGRVDAILATARALEPFGLELTD